MAAVFRVIDQPRFAYLAKSVVEKSSNASSDQKIRNQIALDNRHRIPKQALVHSRHLDYAELHSAVNRKVEQQGAKL